jgi:hypothetical protein
MFDYHGFYIGFWTTVGLLIAGFYIMICCGDDIRKAAERFGDTCNDYIDTISGATAEKMPMDSNIIVEV